MTVQPVVNFEDLMSQESGYIPGAGSRTAWQGVQFNSPILHPSSASLATTGTVSLDPTTAGVFTVTPSAIMTINAKSAPLGQEVILVITTAGTSSFTLTFGTKFKTTGTLATGTSSAKVFTICFVGDGTNLNETSRTTAM